MASLIRQDGRYYLQFHHPHRAPARKRVALHTSRARDAQALRAKLERDYALSVYDPWHDDPFLYDRAPGAPRLTLREATERFLEERREEGLRESTLLTYSDIFRLLMHEAGDHCPVGEVSSKDLRRFVYARHLADATKAFRYRHVKAFLRWCHMKGYVRTCVVAEVAAPAEDEKLPKAVSSEQLEQIVQALESKARRTHRKGEIVWMIPAYRFSFLTGLRAGELARLRWRHVDLERKRIFIDEQKNRTQSYLPICTQAAEILLSLERGGANDYVFRSPRMTAQSRSVKQFVNLLSRAFASARREVGIEEKITVHGLRHAFCTQLARRGTNIEAIRRLARHSVISTTMRYVHAEEEDLRQELESAFR